ncbi:MAG: hypothetical protein O6951_05530 [Actinobacteria bacterium]|nr:hypothetical protein [Actinomycetota bacterium]
MTIRAGSTWCGRAAMGSSAPQGGACGYTNEHAGAGSTEPLLFVNATSFGGDGTCDFGITDFIPPVITLVGADPQVITVGDPFVELGATALDNVDGDLTGSVVIDASEDNASLSDGMRHAELAAAEGWERASAHQARWVALARFLQTHGRS